MWKLTHFPLKEVLGVKGVLGAPRARAKSISKFKLFWRARAWRAQDPIHPEDPFKGNLVLNAHCTPPKGMVYLLKEHLIFHRDIVLQKHTALLQRKIALMKKGMLHFCCEYCMHLLAGMGMLMYIVITLKTSRISCKIELCHRNSAAFSQGKVNTWTLLQAIHPL